MLLEDCQCSNIIPSGRMINTIELLNANYATFGNYVLPSIVPEIFTLRGWRLCEEKKDFKETILSAENPIRKNINYIPIQNEFDCRILGMIRDREHFISTTKIAPVFVELSSGVHPIKSVNLLDDCLKFYCDPKIATYLGISPASDKPYKKIFRKEDILFILPQIRLPKTFPRVN